MPAYADAFLLKLNSTQRKQLALFAPVVVAIFLGGNMLMKPIVKKIKEIDTEKASYSEKETIYKNILEWEKKLSPYLATDGKEVDKTALIEQLNSFASKSGLTLLSVSPDEKKIALSNIESMVIRIDAEGNYHQLAAFISLAESLKTHTRVSSVEINREGGVDSGPSVTGAVKSKAYKISLSLTVYFGARD